MSSTMHCVNSTTSTLYHFHSHTHTHTNRRSHCVLSKLHFSSRFRYTVHVPWALAIILLRLQDTEGFPMETLSPRTMRVAELSWTIPAVWQAGHLSCVSLTSALGRESGPTFVLNCDSHAFRLVPVYTLHAIYTAIYTLYFQIFY
jgi:hypothetical protein